MTDPIQAVEGEAKAVETKVETEAAAEDKAIQDAVHELHLRAVAKMTAEFAAARAAEQRALAWAKARRAALLGIGIGLLLIVIAHYV